MIHFATYNGLWLIWCMIWGKQKIIAYITRPNYFNPMWYSSAMANTNDDIFDQAFDVDFCQLSSWKHIALKCFTSKDFLSRGFIWKRLQMSAVMFRAKSCNFPYPNYSWLTLKSHIFHIHMSLVKIANTWTWYWKHQKKHCDKTW